VDQLTNIYIDVITGHLHKNLNSLFQVEANYILLEKENTQLKEIISGLQGRISVNANIENINEQITKEKTELEEKLACKQKELNDSNNRTKELETEKNALAKKASHVDTFSREIINYQEKLKNKDEKIEELLAKINELEKTISNNTTQSEKQKIPVSNQENTKKKK
jgi:chromosome segregation ATPase